MFCQTLNMSVSVLLSQGGGALPYVAYSVWGHAAGQGMVFGFSCVNGIYNFRRACPKQNKVARLSSLNMGCPKQGPKIEGDVLLRVGILQLKGRLHMK